jgi:hypothetical protein
MFRGCVADDVRCGSNPVSLEVSKCFPVCPRKRTSDPSQSAPGIIPHPGTRATGTAALWARSSQAGKAPLAPSGLKPNPAQNLGLKRFHCSSWTRPAEVIATMAATNKCLAQINKSRHGGEATKKCEIRQPSLIR